jgi:3-oxoacyl-[acyl-carrier-protein] synthase II
MVAPPGSAATEAVVVTGIGLSTALGFGVGINWPRLLAGESAVAPMNPDDFPLPLEMPQAAVARLQRAELAERIRGAVPRQVWNTSEEVCHLWLLTALEALQQAGLQTGEEGAPAPERVGVYVGTGGGAAPFMEQEFVNIYTAPKAVHRDVSRMAAPKYMASSLAGQLSILRQFRGPCMAINTACASGATALVTALDALRLGRVDIAVAGGVDMPVVGTVVKAFYKLGALSSRTDLGPGACRPFQQGRDGMVLGEGAGCLVLERESSAQARGRPALARLPGGAATAEAHHLLAVREGGSGMAATMGLALADAGLEAGAVTHVYTHGTGTPYNDAAEATALHELFPQGPTTSATKSLLGHTLGAAGAIDAVLAVQSLMSGQVVPQNSAGVWDAECPINPALEPARPALLENGAAVLVNAFAFGGHNATLAFSSCTAGEAS